MNDIFKNEGEDSFEENNKYIMSNEELKDMKIETTTNENENEIANELLNNKETNSFEDGNDNIENKIIPVVKYQSNLDNEEKNNKEELRNNEYNENILSNDYNEVKISIKNYLKNKILLSQNKII